MRGVYTASYRIGALASAKTLMYISASSGLVNEVQSASVTNESNETNEQLICAFQKISALGTPSGLVVAPTPHEFNDKASASTVFANIGNEPTYASGILVGQEGYSSIAGWVFNPTPEERFYISPNDTWGLRILNAPTAFDAVIRVTYREIG